MLKQFNIVFIILLSLFIGINAQLISDQKNLIVSTHNSQIIESDALMTNTITIPEGNYYISATYIEYIDNLKFELQGNLIANDIIYKWPIDNNNNKQNILTFYECHNLTITGNGYIDGQGYKWWRNAILAATGLTEDNRPNLLQIESSIGLYIEGISLFNSPRYHIRLRDMRNILIENISITVNSKIPIFPLNTDGIDPSAENVTIRNVNITNYDDAIVVKPCNKSGKYCKCSSNMLIENITTNFSVGMSIGSVSPNKHHSCVRNITFQNIVQNMPFKAIYIKTNPGNIGDGEITNIIYSKFEIYNPLWWPIYIGPQQMQQPDGSGPGCMVKPLKCVTQPLIDINNVSIENINIYNTFWPYAGLINCNETNPCSNILFKNVTSTSKFISKFISNYQYKCQHADIISINSNPYANCTN
jgi:polygalacturonase